MVQHVNRVARALLLALAAVAAGAGEARAQDAAGGAAPLAGPGVDALVAELAAPTRARRLAAQLALLALPPAADGDLARAVAPPGFEAQAALRYVRSHRPRRPRPCAIPAGTYRVGSSYPTDQNPPRDVTLAAYAIDDVEVSCFEWFVYASASGDVVPASWRGRRYPYGAERVPVGGVPREAAARFAAWTGGRLPTTDEWEVAAHGGGTPRAYPWGHEFEPLLREPAPRAWRPDGLPPESASEPHDRAPCGALDFCSSLAEWVVLQDGVIAARGGSYKSGAKELWRLTRAADRRATQARDVVGLRVVDRRR